MAIPASQIVKINATVSGAESSAQDDLQFEDDDMNGAKLIAQSYSGWTRSSANNSGDASYQIIASVLVPGGTMGLNSKLVIVADYENSVSSNIKDLGVLWGGFGFVGYSPTINASAKQIYEIMNANSLASQITINNVDFGAIPAAHNIWAVDTTNDVMIDFRCKWRTAPISFEFIKVVGYSVWHYPGS
jgi:hypothetical protein